MRIQTNLRRIFNFVVNHRKEFFTPQLWATIRRVLAERFSYFDRVTDAEFLYNLQQIETRPWNLHIELTNICNADCIFCAYRFQARKKMIMERTIYSKALNDYCSIGGGELRLETCLGDPLIDPHFVERIQEAHSHPEITKITTLTNGINLAQIGIDKLLQSGIDEIGISTGPWDEHLYQLIYRIEDYHKVRKNVTELLRKNIEYGQPVHIKLLIRSNLSIKKTLELPDYLPISDIPHEIEFNTDFDTWLGNIKQEDLSKGMHLRPLSKVEKEPCYLLYDGPIVFVDGKVGLCGCRDFNANSELIIGNIMENSLLDLWQSETTRRLRERFWKGDFPDICKKCTAYANLDFYRSTRGALRANLVNEWFKLKLKGHVNKLPISAIILTFNEERNIEDCLRSIYDWIDEIFIVDSGSTDRTLGVAKKYIQKIYYHPFENFAQQRNWSQENLPIKNEWIFHLDADERASPELVLELERIFSSNIDVDGFMVARRTVFRGKWIRYGGHYPVYHLRIFKKDKGRSEERLYDQNYIVNGKVLKIKGDIINIINPDIELWKMRHKKWAYLEAQEVLFNKNRIMNIKFDGSPIERRNWFRYKIYYKLPLFIRPFIYFFYRYILRLGFLDGIQGLAFHFWHGFWYRLLVDIKICRLNIRK